MSLTDDYLKAAIADGPNPDELLAGIAPRVADTSYMGRALSRPVFLDRERYQRLSTDLGLVYDALTSLPDRVFGGDLAAFARAVGLTEAQVDVVVRGRGPAPSRLLRADLYEDEDGFRLLELNVGSAIGGLDNTELNRAMLEDPFIAGFVTANELAYVETLAELVETLRTECGTPAGRRPVVAVVDTPESYPVLADRIEKSAEMLAGYGLDCVTCPLDRLDYRDDAVWLDDRRIDVVYRLFVLGDVLQPGGPELLEPVLRAVERGQVAIFTPLDAEVYGTKAALALLCDDRYRDRHSAEEQAAIERLVPWTRIVRPGPVVVDGEQVELADYVADHREELVLKPTADLAGQGVVLGWQTGPGDWIRAVEVAFAKPYVVQRRIRPTAEPFPIVGGVEPWWLSWGVFQVARGFGGAYARGTRQDGGGVVNMTTGATATCVFHQQ